MFLLNFGARSPKSLFEDVSNVCEGRLGACLLASGFDSGQLTRNELPDAGLLLLDPQLYLAHLPVTPGDGRIWRLASHAWFGVDKVVSYDSDEQKKRAWEADTKDAALENWPGRAPSGNDVAPSALAAIETQAEIGCSSVILPAPMLTAREDEGASTVEWTRAGVGAAKSLGCTLPLLATVALDERVLNDAAFNPLGYLDAIVSQVSACPGISGVYIVIAQGGDPEHPFKTGELVWRAYSTLCRRFRRAGRVATVLPNFCDIGGFLCIAHGASGFATGNFQSTRRLMLAGASDGRPYPYYYAHSAAMELRPEDDLDPIAGGGKFEDIADPTPFASTLVAALRSQKTAAGLQPWLMTINNVNTAQRHQIYRFCMTALETLALPVPERYDRVDAWCTKADQLQSALGLLLDDQKTRYVADPAALLAALRKA